MIDPYWLAPPQGSIVPLWHRGGAPNYQPKPMICKHVEDPIKAWGRQKRKQYDGAKISKSRNIVKLPTVIAADKCSEIGTTTHQTEKPPRCNSLQLFHRPQKLNNRPESETDSEPIIHQTESFLRHNGLPLFQRIQEEVHSRANGNRRISIFFCSAGIIAEKLANRLHRWLTLFVQDSSHLQLCSGPKPLNSVKTSDLTPENILFLIVSSTGQGGIPSNGINIRKLCESHSSRQSMHRSQGFRFAIFGNGDSRYSVTYNGAAKKINEYLTQAGGHPLGTGFFQADTAMETIPLSALKSWWNKLQPSIINDSIEGFGMELGRSPIIDKQAAVVVSVIPIEKLGEKYEEHQDRLLSTLGEASLVDASPGMYENGTLLVKFDVDNDCFEEMSCLQILPSNAPSKVDQVLRSLCVGGSDHVDLGLGGKNPTYTSFLTDYVDLELPFTNRDCLEAADLASHGSLTGASLCNLPVQKVLERLHGSLLQMSEGQRCDFIHDLCQDMPLLDTRTYSIASSRHHRSSRDRKNAPGGREAVDIMVKVLPHGRFSETFLRDAAIPAAIRYRIVDSLSGAVLRQHHLKPFVIVATGAGFGPVRALLQWRIAILRNNNPNNNPPFITGSNNKISLFLGLKPSDVDLTLDVLNEAMAHNLVDVLAVVVSNPAKRRVYDELRRSSARLRDKLLRREGVAFVCTNRLAAASTKGVVESILGGGMGEVLGERYVEEVF